MDKEILEVVLKRCARDRKISRVLEVEASPALPKGENYCSNILRLHVKVVLGNGRTANKSFIMKQIHTKDDSLGEWSKENNIAVSEDHIYSVILKEMSYLMEEFEDTEEALWCQFYHFDKSSSSLLFEDLKSIGYKLVPRQHGFDLDHALLTLRGLARYHGMAKVLEERGIINKGFYKPSHVLSDKLFMESLWYRGLLHNAQVIRKQWGSKWEEPTEKLLKIQLAPFIEKLEALSKPEDSEFAVLNHGDCWSNNMMFKYDWKNRPISVKFVDYQVPNYNSPCGDITNFIYLSVQPSVRRQNYQLLLQTYHQGLLSTLDRCGYGGTKPSLQDLTSAMYRFSFAGLVFFLNSYPCITCTSTEAFNFSEILESKGKSGFNSEILNEPGMRKNMELDIIDFVNKHLPIV